MFSISTTPILIRMMDSINMYQAGYRDNYRYNFKNIIDSMAYNSMALRALCNMFGVTVRTFLMYGDHSHEPSPIFKERIINTIKTNISEELVRRGANV